MKTLVPLDLARCTPHTWGTLLAYTTPTLLTTAMKEAYPGCHTESSPFPPSHNPHLTRDQTARRILISVMPGQTEAALSGDLTFLACLTILVLSFRTKVQTETVVSVIALRPATARRKTHCTPPLLVRSMWITTQTTARHTTVLTIIFPSIPQTDKYSVLLGTMR